MSEEVMIVQKYQQAIEIDHSDRCIYMYDYLSGEIINHTQGKLVCVNPELSSAIESHFGIALKEYGVEVKDETFRFENE